MPWNFSGDSADPVEKRRRELEQQERRLAEQMSELEATLEAGGNPAPPRVESGPPVWRQEEEESFVREEGAYDTRRNKPVLRAQRRRDFQVFIFLFIGLVLVVFWLIRTFA